MLFSGFQDLTNRPAGEQAGRSHRRGISSVHFYHHLQKILKLEVIMNIIIDKKKLIFNRVNSL
jgi:hypothetical protein